MTAKTTFAYIPSSHLDLFWLGSYHTCLERGASLIKDYLDRCIAHPEETFLLETVVFAEYFVQRYPEYRDRLRDLVDAGRVEIGTVYVDRWEHLILGESHIRNIQVGAAWSEAFLGRRNPLATHPDLPGMVAQTSQIYAQAGVEWYVTSRKVFPDGAVWRHRAPDGTTLTCLNWPRHYIYYPFSKDDLPTPFDWIRDGIDPEASARMFPLGVVPVNGGAGDLTDPADFRDRYGASLQDLIEVNRARYPQYEFGYSVPSAVLAPYAAVDTLPVVDGEIPSVWGVACDEEVVFFRRNRESEYRLLAAETLTVMLEQFGEAGLPEMTTPWQGRFYESAFFATKDPMPTGREFAELWKMHLFTEDHNGGGYEAALSTFQKRMMQNRVWQYTGEILDHGVSRIGARLRGNTPGILAVNTLGQGWSGPLAMSIPAKSWEAGLRPVDASGAALPAQVVGRDHDSMQIVAAVEEIPAVGYRHVPFARVMVVQGFPSSVQESPAAITMTLGGTAVSVDKATGAITSLGDAARGADWGRGELGAMRAIRETVNDVTLRTDEASEPVESTLRGISVDIEGPLFSAVRIEREILGNTVEQVVSLWHDGHAELETRVRWSGAHNWQLRLALPTSSTADGVAYGSPFHGSGWTEITADCGPRNGDEVLPEDYHRYREVQEWLHVREGDAGLLQVTTHPGFCFADRGLEAVLLRTSPSCGDPRFFWENAGEQVYRFAWYPTGADWREAGVIARAQQVLRSPVTGWVEPAGGDMPEAMGFLSLIPDGAVLTSLSRNVESGVVDIRVVEARGQDVALNVGGALVEGATVTPVDLRGRAVSGTGEAFTLTPWHIQTFAVESVQ